MTGHLPSRPGRGCLLSNRLFRLIHVRTLSSIVCRAAQTTSVKEAHFRPQQHQPLQETYEKNSSLYPAAPTRHAPKPLSDTHDEFSKAFQHFPGDPLQHILNHPSASIVLRDACRCARCKDQSTSQREFNIANIPSNIEPLTTSQDASGSWTVRWLNDMPGWEDHVSVYTPQQIERLSTHMAMEHRTSTQFWNRQNYTQNRCSVDYQEYMTSDAALAKTLYDFARFGLVFIENVPEDTEAVGRMAERVAMIKSTFYGRTWDVKSVPNAKNVAYTSKHLGFHADLMYYKEPPTVQYLHCIHNTCAGGESRFVDQFAALDTLYCEDSDAAAHLAEIRLRYEYDNDGMYYSDIKPIVQWRTDGHTFPHRTTRGAFNGTQMKSVHRMFWAPPFLGSILTGSNVVDNNNNDLGSSTSNLGKSLAAMKSYADILERDELVYEEKMTPGTCVMFDNLRVLHARNAFDVNTGRRWLRGTYLDAQDLWSTEIRLKHYMADLEAAYYPSSA